MKKSLILAALLGSMVALGAVAATTDEIIRLVYDSTNTAFRIVNFDGSPIGTFDLTVGTTAISGGGDKFCLFDDGGTVGADAGCQYDKALDAITLGGALGDANSITIGDPSGQITFEGATADGFETRFSVADPTVGDQTWTLPNYGAAVTRTVASREGAETFTGAKTMNGGRAAFSCGAAGWNISVIDG